jgi:replication factor A1
MSPIENTAEATTMTELRTHAAEIAEQFSDHVDVTEDEVETKLQQLVEEYQVPLDEATRSVRNSYLEEAGIERDEISQGGNERLLVNDIDQDEQWVDLRVKLVDLWDPRSDSISQVGLLGDESGTIKFVAFETSELEQLEEGQCYELSNVVTDEYQGTYSVKLNRTTTITEIDEEIEVGDNSETVEGALVDVQSGSGLIKRCPEENCTRVLQNGRCAEHGEVDGEFDLRIKAVLDDGHEVQDVIFNREATEKLTGIELDEAKQLAKDALDTTVVADEMRADILGRYFTVTGPTLGRYVLANEFEQHDGPADAESVLIKARSI